MFTSIDITTDFLLDKLERRQPELQSIVKGTQYWTYNKIDLTLPNSDL